jgi:lipid II:glycine glycyltransferase (peptidoglycan interpeptide bridge formation enzyme)
MQIVHFSPTQQHEWNRFVARDPSFALLQSWEWGTFKEKMGWKVYRIAVLNHEEMHAAAQVLVRSFLGGRMSMIYVPRGPLGDWLNEEVFTALWSELDRIARDHRAIFLRLEPASPFKPAHATTLNRYGFRTSTYTNQPRATITIDLTPEADEILARMQQKTRYNIRYAQKKGLTVQEGGYEDLPAFYRLMQITARRGGFPPRTLEYYQAEWEALAANHQIRLFLGSYKGNVIAANVSAIFGQKAAYLHGASSGEHSNLQPNSLLMWKAIEWAKANHCSLFDLWGIPDEVGQAAWEGRDLPETDRLDGLWGVYRFKRGFSHSIVYYLGAYDYVYSPALYAVIQQLTQANLSDRLAVWLDTLRSSR